MYVRRCVPDINICGYLHNKKDIALIIILLLFIFFMIALQNLTREATINVLTNLQKAI